MAGYIISIDLGNDETDRCAESTFEWNGVRWILLSIRYL